LALYSPRDFGPQPAALYVVKLDNGLNGMAALHSSHGVRVPSSNGTRIKHAGGVVGRFVDPGNGDGREVRSKDGDGLAEVIRGDVGVIRECDGWDVGKEVGLNDEGWDVGLKVGTVDVGNAADRLGVGSWLGWFVIGLVVSARREVGSEEDDGLDDKVGTEDTLGAEEMLVGSCDTVGSAETVGPAEIVGNDEIGLFVAVVGEDWPGLTVGAVTKVWPGLKVGVVLGPPVVGRNVVGAGTIWDVGELLGLAFSSVGLVEDGLDVGAEVKSDLRGVGSDFSVFIAGWDVKTKLGFVEVGLDVGGKVDSNWRGGIGALVGFDVVGLEVGIKLGFVEVGFDVGGKVDSNWRGGIGALVGFDVVGLEVGTRLGFVEVGFDVGGKVDSNWRGGIGALVGLDVGINDEVGLGLLHWQPQLQYTSLDDLDDLDLTLLEVDESVRFAASTDIALGDFDLDVFDVYVQLVVLDLYDFAFDDFDKDESPTLSVALTFMRLSTFGWTLGAFVVVSFRPEPDVERDPQLFTPTSDRMWLQLPPFSSLSW
jgi:hypothetical protein